MNNISHRIFEVLSNLIFLAVIDHESVSISVLMVFI